MTILLRLCACMTRRWPLTLTACLALCALSILTHSVTALPATVLAVLLGLWLAYLLSRPAPNPAFRLAQGQLLREIRTIAVDGALLRSPRQVCEVCLPFQPVPEKQMRLRPGALFLAAAVTVTTDLTAQEDRAALRAAVANMGFNENFLARCPILEGVSSGGVYGYIVKDGHGRRAYFTGCPADVAAMCATVFDQSVQPMTDAAREELTRQEGWGYAMAAVTDAGMEPPTYLGCVRVAEDIRQEAVDAAVRLQQAGYTVTVLADDPVPQGALLISQEEDRGASMQFIPQEDFATPLLAAVEAESCFAQYLICTLLSILPALVMAGLWKLSWWMAPLSLVAMLPGQINLRPAAVTSLRTILFLPWTLISTLLCILFLQRVGATQACGMLMLWLSAAMTGLWPPFLRKASRRLWQVMLPTGAGFGGCALTVLLLRPAPAAAAFALLAAGLIMLVNRLLALPGQKSHIDA